MIIWIREIISWATWWNIINFCVRVLFPVSTSLVSNEHWTKVLLADLNSWNLLLFFFSDWLLCLSVLNLTPKPDGRRWMSTTKQIGIALPGNVMSFMFLCAGILFGREMMTIRTRLRLFRTKCSIAAWMRIPKLDSFAAACWHVIGCACARLCVECPRAASEDVLNQFNVTPLMHFIIIINIEICL